MRKHPPLSEAEIQERAEQYMQVLIAKEGSFIHLATPHKDRKARALIFDRTKQILTMMGIKVDSSQHRNDMKTGVFRMKVTK